MAFGDLGTKSARLVEWLSGGCRLSGRKCKRRKVAALNIFLSLSRCFSEPALHIRE